MSRGVDAKWEVMHAILARGEASPTHVELAQLTSQTPRTISNVIGRVRPLGLVEGRRPVQLGVGLGMALGISLGTESMRAGLVDANGKVRKSLADPPRPGQLDDPPWVTLERIQTIAGRVLEEAIADNSLRPPKSSDLLLAGAAVAWPSPLDRDKRPRGLALRHESWRKGPDLSQPAESLPDLVAAALGPPFSSNRCHALNDVSAHALTVAFEASRQDPRSQQGHGPRVDLVIRIGGGLGSGIVVTGSHDPRRLSFVDAKSIEGTHGLAGELGHLPVGRDLIEEINQGSSELAPMDYDSWTCSCGRNHHLEAFASGMALLRRFRASGYDIPETSEGHAALLRAIAEGELEKDQRDALRDVGRIIGSALAAPVLILDPHTITVTGSLATPEVVDGIRRVRDSWASVIEDSVEVEGLGGEAGAWAAVRGAALAVLRRTVYRGFLDKRLEFPDAFAVSAADIKRMRS